MNKCYVKLMGRLGNQLFQIATAYAYCQKYNLSLRVNTKGFIFDGDPNSIPFRETIFKNFNYEVPDECEEFIETNHWKYTELPQPQLDKDIHIIGYFQSLKYFEEYSQEFENLLYLPSVLDVDPKRVAFHIRRGDYTIIPKMISQCGTEYFQRCFEYFKDYEIDIFTDSPRYVTEEFKQFKFNLLPTTSSLYDLTLMSKYKNIVCSNSTFSWWGSFIGGKKDTIITPKLWMDDGNNFDIYRQEFIRL